MRLAPPMRAMIGTLSLPRLAVNWPSIYVTFCSVLRARQGQDLIGPVCQSM